MNSVLIPAAERARNAKSRVLAALKDPGSQVAIAASMGVSEATVTRIKNDRLDECLAFLYTAGFKVVPQESVSVDPSRLDTILTAAQATFATVDALRDFVLEGA